MENIPRRMMCFRLDENHGNQRTRICLFIYECVRAPLRKRSATKAEKERNTENNQPLYTLIYVIAQIVYDMCLCRVCRTRVFLLFFSAVTPNRPTAPARHGK